MIKWFKKWYEWQARCINGKFYKLMVLFKIIKSPSMRLAVFGECFSQEFEKQQRCLIEEDQTDGHS
jgi:hypothetical protein